MNCKKKKEDEIKFCFEIWNLIFQFGHNSDPNINSQVKTVILKVTQTELLVFVLFFCKLIFLYLLFVHFLIIF